MVGEVADLKQLLPVLTVKLRRFEAERRAIKGSQLLPADGF